MRVHRRVEDTWTARLKDRLHALGLLPAALRLLWAYRYHRGRLTGDFVMRAVPLPGIPPGPRVIEVPLASLRYLSTKFVWERHFKGGFVCSGNWDEVIRRRRPTFDEHPAADETDLGAYEHRTVIDMFLGGVPAQQTGEYRHLAERIARGGAPRGCTSLEELDAHFAQLRHDHAAMVRGDFGRRSSDGRLVPHVVKVFVDRDGQLIHRSHGLHQLRLAELCGLRRVPVEVLAVHLEWLRPHLVRHAAPADALEEALTSLSLSDASKSDARASEA